MKNIEKENEERRRKAMMSLITQVQQNSNPYAKKQYVGTYGTTRTRQWVILKSTVFNIYLFIELQRIN